MLRIDVSSTPYELTLVEGMAHSCAVVIDALRATSTITTAIHNGCKRIIPVTTTAEATAEKERNPQALLAGERKGAKLSGYDFGNSPLEFEREVIAGKEVIFTTSNGTPALVACDGASLTVVASFLNRAAVARTIQASGRDVLIACAGHHGKMAAEDLACAGSIIDALVGGSTAYYLTDGALAAHALFREWSTRLSMLLSQSFSGKNITGLGYERDIAYCAQVDLLDVVPVYKGKQIIRT